MVLSPDEMKQGPYADVDRCIAKLWLERTSGESMSVGIARCSSIIYVVNGGDEIRR